MFIFYYLTVDYKTWKLFWVVVGETICKWVLAEYWESVQGSGSGVSTWNVAMNYGPTSSGGSVTGSHHHQPQPPLSLQGFQLLHKYVNESYSHHHHHSNAITRRFFFSCNGLLCFQETSQHKLSILTINVIYFHFFIDFESVILTLVCMVGGMYQVYPHTLLRRILQLSFYCLFFAIW